jgi:hypothetical protein
MRRVLQVVQVDIDGECLMDFHLSNNAIRVTVCDDWFSRALYGDITSSKCYDGRFN